MADLEVIYDPEKQIATLYSPTNMLAGGPAIPGQNGAAMLQAFIDAAPFDLADVESVTLAGLFASFAEHAADQLAASPSPPAAQPADAGAPAPAAAPAVPDAASGAPTDEPPAPAPADTDPTATMPAAPDGQDAPATGAPAPENAPAAPAAAERTCPHCGGSGSVQADDPPQTITCGFCAGSGKVAL